MDGTMSRGERWRLAGAILFGLTAGTGCMSFNLGNTYERPNSTSYIDSAGVLKQHDETALAKTPDGQHTIYYARPFANKPNLKFKKTSDAVNPQEIEIVEQLPDRFTIRYRGFNNDPVLAWQAEGMPGTITVAIPPVPDGKGITQVKGEQ
jgi:hypothetical protein